MKKLVSMCLVLVLLLTLGSVGAFAATKTAPKITVPAKLIGAYYLSGGDVLVLSKNDVKVYTREEGTTKIGKGISHYVLTSANKTSVEMGSPADHGYESYITITIDKKGVKKALLSYEDADKNLTLIYAKDLKALTALVAKDKNVAAEVKKEKADIAAYDSELAQQNKQAKDQNSKTNTEFVKSGDYLKARYVTPAGDEFSFTKDKIHFIYGGGKELSFDIKGVEVQEGDKVNVLFNLESNSAKTTFEIYFDPNVSDRSPKLIIGNFELIPLDLSQGTRCTVQQ